MSGAQAVGDMELGERTSGIKPFFRYVTPWPDRERSFEEKVVSAGRSTYFPDDVLASLHDYNKFPRRRYFRLNNATLLGRVLHKF